MSRVVTARGAARVAGAAEEASSVAGAEEVRGEDGEAPGVDREAGADERAPPAEVGGGARERVEEEDDVPAVGVDLALEPVGLPHVAQRLPRLEGEVAGPVGEEPRSQGGRVGRPAHGVPPTKVPHSSSCGDASYPRTRSGTP